MKLPNFKELSKFAILYDIKWHVLNCYCNEELIALLILLFL